MSTKTSDSLKKPAVSPFFVTLNSRQNTGSFGELLDAWVDYCRTEGLSPRTTFDYTDKVGRFIRWWVVHTKYGKEFSNHPAKVTVTQAREFVDTSAHHSKTDGGLITIEPKTSQP